MNHLKCNLWLKAIFNSIMFLSNIVSVIHWVFQVCLSRFDWNTDLMILENLWYGCIKLLSWYQINDFNYLSTTWVYYHILCYYKIRNMLTFTFDIQHWNCCKSKLTSVIIGCFISLFKIENVRCWAVLKLQRTMTMIPEMMKSKRDWTFWHKLN